MAGLPYPDLAAGACPHGAHDVAQRLPRRILVRTPRAEPVLARSPAQLTLVGPVIVDADHIEMGAAAAEFGQEAAAQHVPALEDQALVEVTDLLLQIGTALGTG